MTDVLVVAAMRPEIDAFMAEAGARAADVRTGLLGIGTARARAATEQLLQAAPEPELVLVLGIAGGVGPSVAVGDLVVPEVVLDGASGEQRCPVPLPGLEQRGVLHTSDALLSDPVVLADLAARGVVALDMESAAVAAVCDEAGVPWAVARGISDHVDTAPVDPAVLALTGPEGQGNPEALAAYLAEDPSRADHLARLATDMVRASTASARAALTVLDALP